MYLIKSNQVAKGPVNEQKWVTWQADQIRFVDPEVYTYYAAHTDVFTVLRTPDQLEDVLYDMYSLYSDGVHNRELPYDAGAIAAAYIDFNDVGEAASSITIDGVAYTEADTADAPNGVWTNGASAADSATSFIAAVNGDTRAAVPFTAVADASGDGAWLFWDAVGTDGNVIITTDSAGNITVQNSSGGVAATARPTVFIRHTVNTQELLSGAIEIPLAITPYTHHIQAFSATGLQKAFSDLVTTDTSPDRLVITTDGATNLANTDVLHILVSGTVE